MSVSEDKQLVDTKRFCCIEGTCKDCTEIVGGKGIHVVEEYEVYKGVECDECNGEGSTERECMSCEGSGYTEDTCLSCKGKGVISDELSDNTFLRKEKILVKPKHKHTEVEVGE
jgi:hypothetical protein